MPQAIATRMSHIFGIMLTATKGGREGDLDSHSSFVQDLALALAPKMCPDQSQAFKSFSVFPFLSFFVCFYLSFRLVVFRCFWVYRILGFCFRVPAFLGGGFFHYSVISSWRYTSARAPCELQVCVFPLRAVFIGILMLIFFPFSSSPFFCVIYLFFRYRFGRLPFVSSSLFLVGTIYQG